MTIMTSREFNQNTHLAQKYAQDTPVIITNRGKPTFVLMTYEDYQQTKSANRSIADALADDYPDAANIELELQDRSKTQRSIPDFGEI